MDWQVKWAIVTSWKSGRHKTFMDIKVIPSAPMSNSVLFKGPMLSCKIMRYRHHYVLTMLLVWCYIKSNLCSLSSSSTSANQRCRRAWLCNRAKSPIFRFNAWQIYKLNSQFMIATSSHSPLQHSTLYAHHLHNLTFLIRVDLTELRSNKEVSSNNRKLIL